MRAFELTEAFDKPYQLKWIRKDETEWLATTVERVAGNQIFRLHITENQGFWLIEFNVGFEIATTGTGDAFRIFSTVLVGIEEFVNTVEPEIMVIDAAKDQGDSRESLYRRLIKKLIPAGYSVSEENTNYETRFILTRENSKLTEDVGDFKMSQSIHSAVTEVIPKIQNANLNQVGSVVRRVSKLLEPIVLQYVSVPEGFSFEVKIQKRERGSPSGRMNLQWDDMLETRKFVIQVFVSENIISDLFVYKKDLWANTFINQVTTTMVHEIVHLQQFSKLVTSLVARGYDDHKYLNLSDKITSREYLDRPIEAQAFGVEDANRIFFNIAENETDQQTIVTQLKQVRSDMPRSFRQPDNSIFKKWPDYIDPHHAFEDNPYFDRTNKRGARLSETTRRTYMKWFVVTIDRIISELESTNAN